MILWLHSQGYTYLTIPKLTYKEIEGLIDAMNRKNKKEEQMQRKMSRKSKLNKGRYKR